MDTSRRLLVIDDELGIRDYIRTVAEARGYDVVLVEKQAAFEQACRTFKPTVIFIDVVMPDVDGIMLVRNLAAEGVRARVVVMSGFGERYIRNTVQIGSALGIEDIRGMAKPFNYRELCDALDGDGTG
ncbi:MAG: response regulator [Sphingomonadales bacterium]